ncbi:unnamed protein product [Ilex paraguariensis]|uniref:Uncharacterized protein n=1 Tax=Ilex paraguariensis TaxID=185542 RepID=A0ABC8TIX1_9AQUA
MEWMPMNTVNMVSLKRRVQIWLSLKVLGHGVTEFYCLLLVVSLLPVFSRVVVIEVGCYENERLAKMSIESLNKLADKLEHRTSYQSLKEELKRASDDLVRKENVSHFISNAPRSVLWCPFNNNNSNLQKQECRNAIESLEQDHAMRINELETQVSDLSSQKAANEATINELHQDLATHRNHIEALKSRLERIHSDVESRYHYEIQDLKDCLLIEQEEKNELSKKLQDLEKELLISRTKLAEHQRDLTSNRHVETLKQKIMKLRKENEVLKGQQLGSKKG